MKNQQFPDLIKAGLKVGDKVYSYLYGEGVVDDITKGEYPIEVEFNLVEDSFTNDGKNDAAQLIPSLTLTPWNPIIGEPFPFPKWEPKEGEWCAFWDDGDEVFEGFIISKFIGMKKKYNEDKESKLKEWLAYAYGLDGCSNVKDNCAPISQAMVIFAVKEVDYD